MAKELLWVQVAMTMWSVGTEIMEDLTTEQMNKLDELDNSPLNDELKKLIKKIEEIKNDPG